MPDGRQRRFLIMLLVVLAAATALRTLWLTADPPTHATLGIVWHDEGAWVHNARNRALWGTWRTDGWNPVFVSPVFTALEYFAFAVAGVGTWQARAVPVASGLLAVLALTLGIRALAGTRPAVMAGLLLATNYVFVMWNRAALMESTMTAFMVVSWAAYAAARRRPSLGVVAGAAAALAWFSKAAAAFYIAALLIDAGATIALSLGPIQRLVRAAPPEPGAIRGAWATILGLSAAAAIVAGLFVLPYWQEYRFYNWQMSVTRKPSYTIGALLDRASWLPMVHDFFTRMWLVMVAATLAAIGIVSRWRSASPGERLLLLWLVVGLAELVVHDSGNERRYVMFIPPLIGLASLLVGSRQPFATLGAGTGARWLALPLCLLAAYLVVGSLLRLAFPEVREGDMRAAVRLSAVLAAVGATALLWFWPKLSRWLSAQPVTDRAMAIVVLLVVASDLAQFAQWAAARTHLNHRASQAINDVLAPGTLVHGKLANGMALENRIRPLFVGRGFGNYEDRLHRDDVRYILTYISPRVGYEGSVITDVLDGYPDHSIIMTFDVAETATGHDRAALIDKFGSRRSFERLPVDGRARD
jgi:4-amino-4-deoxy-L-arabinose transferase-like glycosyltransferase